MLASTDTGTYGIGLSAVQTDGRVTTWRGHLGINWTYKFKWTWQNWNSTQGNTTLLKGEKHNDRPLCCEFQKCQVTRGVARENTFCITCVEWSEWWGKGGNDHYCMHLVLNLQEYAGAPLKELVKVESTTGNISWGQKESATVLAIWYVKRMVPMQLSEQAGSPNEFMRHLADVGNEVILKHTEEIALTFLLNMVLWCIINTIIPGPSSSHQRYTFISTDTRAK